MTDENPTPAAYEHCRNVYAKMKEYATAEKMTVDVPGVHEVDATQLVYEGFFSQLFQELALSPPYYTKVRALLIKMGCVEQLRRGGGNSKSRWRLVREPTEEAFNVAINMKGAPQGKVASLEQQLRAMNTRVTRLEAALGISP